MQLDPPALKQKRRARRHHCCLAFIMQTGYEGQGTIITLAHAEWNRQPAPQQVPERLGQNEARGPHVDR